jgi:hypothetical protein
MELGSPASTFTQSPPSGQTCELPWATALSTPLGPMNPKRRANITNTTMSILFIFSSFLVICKSATLNPFEKKSASDQLAKI